MKRPAALWSIPVAAALLLLLPAAASAVTPAAVPLGPGHLPEEAVFTMSNAVAGNSVLAYAVGPGGELTPAGNFSTGGTGTGASLADQGSIVLTPDDQFLLAVNAGDSTISVFALSSHGPHGPLLTLVDLVGSRGIQPVSLTVHDSVVYVLNAGNATVPGNIAGFYLSFSGDLAPIRGSVQPLSSSAPVGPAEVAFNPEGTVLVVTEEDTNLIDAFPVHAGGIAHAPVISPSNGTTPYGFAFSERGALVVSDAASGALSSYALARNGELTVLSGSIPDGQAAPCWVAISGSYAFTSNAHGNTISSYRIGGSGTLSLAIAVAASTALTDTDLAVGGWQNQDLFVHDAGAGEIQEFAIGAGGTLALVTSVSSLPPASEGLAVA
jgi:6-phosphogluconolactonase